MNLHIVGTTLEAVVISGRLTLAPKEKGMEA